MKEVETLTWYLEMRSKPELIEDSIQESSVQESRVQESRVQKSLVKEFGMQEFGMQEFRIQEFRIQEKGLSVSALKADNPVEYLSMYKAVGEDFNWVDRLIMPTEKLMSILQDVNTEILVLRQDGNIAGFSELHHISAKEIEIVYFGLTRSYAGKGLGFLFLSYIIAHAWIYPIERLWLHTCDLDHPAALPLYQKAGFVVYKTERIMQPVYGI